MSAAGTQYTLDQRNALYRLAQRAIGRLDALDPFGDEQPIEYEQIRELRHWLAGAVDEILPPGDAIVEEVTGG